MKTLTYKEVATLAGQGLIPGTRLIDLIEECLLNERELKQKPQAYFIKDVANKYLITEKGCGLLVKHMAWHSRDTFKKQYLYKFGNPEYLRIAYTEQKEKHGTVYLIRCNDKIKIGSTKKGATSRLKSLQTGNPYELELIYEVPSIDCKQLEFEAQQKYKLQNIRGEWFNLNDRQLSDLKDFLAADTENNSLAFITYI